MKIERTKRINGPVIVEPRIFEDSRGHFYESYSKQTFNQHTGLNLDFMQDNHVFSVKGVVRGMHWQIKRPMDKLVRCVKGEIFDVAVDIRKNSPTFKEWVSVKLTEKNKKMFLVPKGFAHGYLALTDETVVLYKCSNVYCTEGERAFKYNDPIINIEWPEIDVSVSQSEKDDSAPLFENLTKDDLFL
ncbi:MAG: dTDP-4-dehydrorhamnose 3,5-epimerase [Candidatus Aureabacteria bacterium]|nr:dTDP-4-dehydrorhamnose 3,5-epimerase [Candidatus Auribacterota bacterium]